MRRICSGGLFAVVLATVISDIAGASGIDDFNRGLAANNRGDFDTAVASFTQSLSSDDLLPNLRPIALLDRGWAYAKNKRYAEAVADFGAAIKLKPNEADAYSGRAQALYWIGEKKAAADDCKALWKLGIADPVWLSWCGRLFWEVADYAEAESFIERAIQLRPKSAAYNDLWLALIWLRTGRTDRQKLGEYVSELDIDDWPLPLLELFLGKSSINIVTWEEQKGDTQTRQKRTCEAGFYLGEWDFMHGDTASAKNLFQQAAEYCPQNYIELAPAKLEFSQLSAAGSR